MHSKNYLCLIAVLLLCMAFFGGQGLADDKIACRNYLEIAHKIVPEEVGDDSYIKSLVSVKDGADWMVRFSEDRMKEILGDRELERIDAFDDQIGVYRSKTSILRYNKIKGEIKCFNRSRSFDFQKSHRKAVDEKEGEKSIDPVLNMIPLNEMEKESYNSVVLMGAAGSIEEEKKVLTFEAERHYRFTRVVGGIPVLGSKIFAAVSNSGELAKLRVRWPRFTIDSELREYVRPLSREVVAEAVYRELVNQNRSCAPLAVSEAYVAYVPVEKDLTPDSEGLSKDGLVEAIVYVPKLVVLIKPESEEESGEEFLVDILESSVSDDTP